MNANELGLIITMIILLLIAFFIIGYMYAKIRYSAIIARILSHRPSNVAKIKITSKDQLDKFMSDLFDGVENEDDDNDNGRDS